MAGLKRKHQGPPCVLNALNNKTVPIKLLRQLVLSALGECSLGGHEKPYYVLHNWHKVERVVLIEVPRTISGVNVPIKAEESKAYVLAEFAERKSPVFANVGRVPKGKHAPRVKSAECTLESLCVSDLTNYGLKGVKLDSKPGTGAGFAIDCEMCLSGSESVLTRLAVTNFETNEVLVDKLVKPSTEITDYVTEYSGITEAMLNDVTFTQSDAQKLLRDLIGSSDILVGHSIENDLKVLGIQHNKLVDTAELYPHIRGLPFRNSLKYIAKKYLDSVIQTNQSGHNPVIDAQTSADLVKVIMKHGKQYGDARTETEALSTVLSKNGVRTAFVGQESPEWDVYGCADYILHQNIADCVKAAVSNQAQLLCVSLTSELQGFSAESVNEAIETIYKAQQPNTAVFVSLGPSTEVADEFKNLLRRKKEYKHQFKTKKWDEIEEWTLKDEDHIKQVKEKLSMYTLFADVVVDEQSVHDLPEKVRKRYLEHHN